MGPLRIEIALLQKTNGPIDRVFGYGGDGGEAHHETEEVRRSNIVREELNS